jgi:hypothetical protein
VSVPSEEGTPVRSAVLLAALAVPASIPAMMRQDMTIARMIVFNLLEIRRTWCCSQTASKSTCPFPPRVSGLPGTSSLTVIGNGPAGLSQTATELAPFQDSPRASRRLGRAHRLFDWHEGGAGSLSLLLWRSTCEG